VAVSAAFFQQFGMHSLTGAFNREGSMRIFSNEGIIFLMVMAGCWMFVLGPAIDRLVAGRVGYATERDPAINRLGITGWGNMLFIPLLLGVFAGRMFVIMGI